MYTASTNSWTQIAPLPFGASNAGACVVAGGWLYFASSDGDQLARFPVGH
jgi:hypothetical protein